MVQLILAFSTLATFGAAANPAVVVTPTKITIKKDVAFQPAKAKPTASGRKLIHALADALKANPRFTKVRIEGHTDNQGNNDFNLKLSQKRADAVKRVLIADGIAATRLAAEGFGASRPIATNKTARGRKKNRRVELITLEIDGKRIRKGKRPPLAKLTALHNDVGASRPEAPEFEGARVGMGLGKSWRVKTEASSSAGITFRDASALEMREQSLVIIFGATGTKTKTVKNRARLKSGALSARLGELAGKGIVVETDSAEAVLGSGHALVNVDSRGASTVSNFSGKSAKVYGRKKSGKRSKKSVRVARGYGSRVKKGKPPQKPRKLPPTPVHTQTDTLRAVIGPFATATLQGEWKPVAQAVKYRVQARRTAPAGTAPFSQEVDAKSHSFRFDALDAGKYEVQVSAIDDQGFESAPSLARSVEVVRLALGGPAPSKKGAGPDTALRPGDTLTVPEGLTCALDVQKAVGPATLTVGNVATQSVTCEAADGAAPNVIPLVVSPSVIAWDELALTGGQAQRVRLSVAGRTGAPPRLAVTGATLTSSKVNVSEGDTAVLEAMVTPDDNVTAATIRVLAGETVLAEKTSPIVRDVRAPVLEKPSFSRVEDKISIRVSAQDTSGVRYITARWSDQSDKQAVFLTRVEEDTFVGELSVLTAPDDRTVVLASADTALNASVNAYAVPPEMLGTPGSIWFPIAIMAGGAVPAIIALVATGDALTAFAGGPLIGGQLNTLTGGGVEPNVLLGAEVITAVLGGAVALVIVGIGAAGLSAALWGEGE